MNETDLKTLMGELAPMTQEQRREHLLTHLEPGVVSSGPDDRLPEWFSELIETTALQARRVEEVRAHIAAEKDRAPGPSILPSVRLKQIRYDGELKEAQFLAMSPLVMDDDSAQPPDGVKVRRDLHDLVQLDEADFSEVSQMWEMVKKALNTEAEARFVLDAGAEGVSVEVLQEGSTSTILLIFSPESLTLTTLQLAFLVGRQMGRLLFDHAWYERLKIDDSAVSLPDWKFAEAMSALLRWRIRAPFTTDRTGMLSCGSLVDSVYAMLRSEMNLTAAQLPGDASSLLSFAAELKICDEGVHPFAERIEALRVFASRIELRHPLSGKNVDSSAFEPTVVEGGNQESKSSPTKISATSDPNRARIHALASGGLAVLAADGDLNAGETRLLVEALFRSGEWYPEQILRDVARAPLDSLSEALKMFRAEATREDACWLIDQLAQIALADGLWLGLEAPVVLRIAEVCELSTQEIEAFIGTSEPSSGLLENDSDSSAPTTG